MLLSILEGHWISSLPHRMEYIYIYIYHTFTAYVIRNRRQTYKKESESKWDIIAPYLYNLDFMWNDETKRKTLPSFYSGSSLDLNTVGTLLFPKKHNSRHIKIDQNVMKLFIHVRYTVIQEHMHCRNLTDSITSVKVQSGHRFVRHLSSDHFLFYFTLFHFFNLE